MNHTRTIHRRIRFHSGNNKSALDRDGAQSMAAHVRIPRVARLMALAIRLEALIAAGRAPNFAALARLADVTRARMTQITNLTLLAPDIQEAVLFLQTDRRGPDPITERDLRPIAAEPDWSRQRIMWARLTSLTRADVSR